MRCIGSLPDGWRARQFADYLVASGVPSQVEENSTGAWDIWVQRDEQLDHARAELARFSAAPDDPRYEGADSQARRIREEEESRAQRLRRNFMDVRTQWGGRRGLPQITLTVMVLAILVGVGTQLGMRDTPLLQWMLFAPYSESGEIPREDDSGGVFTGGDRYFAGEGMFGAISRGQVWRLFTPALIHFGALHLIFNLYWLFRFGQMIETIKGPLLFGLLVIGGALVGNLAEALWTQMDFLNRGSRYAAFGGLSGLNYALFGYVWLSGRLRPRDEIGADPQTSMILFAWLVLCMTGMVGPVANTAHLAGLAVGLAIAWLNPRLPRRRTIG